MNDIRSGCAVRAAIQDHDLRIQNDPHGGVITIEGVTYAHAVFKLLGGVLFPKGEWVQLVDRTDGVLTLRRMPAGAHLVTPEQIAADDVPRETSGAGICIECGKRYACCEHGDKSCPLHHPKPAEEGEVIDLAQRRENPFPPTVVALVDETGVIGVMASQSGLDALASTLHKHKDHPVVREVAEGLRHAIREPHTGADVGDRDPDCTCDHPIAHLHTPACALYVGGHN